MRASVGSALISAPLPGNNSENADGDTGDNFLPCILRIGELSVALACNRIPLKLVWNGAATTAIKQTQDKTNDMKKLLVALCLTCAMVLAVQAQDAKQKKRDLTAEQKQIRKELLEKYDANKDGKLSKEERSKVSEADKDKLDKAGLGARKKKDSK
jgi:hypothetical protein